jgi:hypothetical protein
VTGARRHGLRALLAIVVAVFAALLVGCEREDEAVVDPVLVAFLSKARAAHHRADLAEKAGDGQGAVLAVSTIIEGPRPTSTPEVVEVLADALARRADLKSRLGDFEDADRDVDAGLSLAIEVSHFRGHLFEVRGLVAERRADAFEARGEKTAASRSRERAIAAYEEAIEVQDRVIRAALGGGP